MAPCVADGVLRIVVMPYHRKKTRKISLILEKVRYNYNMVRNTRIYIWFPLIFLLCFIVLIGCSSSSGSGGEATTTTTTTTSTTTTTLARADLSIATFEADADYLSVTVTNEGGTGASDIEVKFRMDAIYESYPDGRVVTVESLGAGTSTGILIMNTLTPTYPNAGHSVMVEVDYRDAITESDEDNNTAYSRYYDGDYAELYEFFLENYTTYRDLAKQRCQDYYNFSPSGNYEIQLVDSLTYEGGSAFGMMGVRYPVPLYSGGIAYPTAVVYLNLEEVADGYPTYVYDDVTYESNSSFEVIVHEYVHAYHWEYVYADQRGSWSDVPTWLREGIAVYGAGQGTDRVRSTMAGHMGGGYNTVDTTKAYVLEGLVSNDDHGFVNYAQDYMALEYIVNTYGLSTLQAIIEDNANGTSAEAAVVNNLPDVSSWYTFNNIILYNYCAATVEAYYANIPSFPFARQLEFPLPVD